MYSPLKKTQFAAMIFVVAFLALSESSQVQAAPGIVVHDSSRNFDQTVLKLKQGISANMLVLLKDFNHQTMLKMVGVHADKSMVLEVFHPRYGKVIYANDKSAFIVPPLRIMVQEDGGKVIVYYQKASVLLAPYKGLDDLGEDLDFMLANIVNGVI
ncbi:MAG TPA: DUF302 domain-containing protein [Alphaproteobacteria bacterium]|nr:DUF302 domain-containing protein [Alphaproteobacteria bacterium]